MVQGRPTFYAPPPDTYRLIIRSNPGLDFAGSCTLEDCKVAPLSYLVMWVGLPGGTPKKETVRSLNPRPSNLKPKPPKLYPKT